MAWEVREVCFVAIESWAGRTTHEVQIEKLDALRARVRWLGASTFNKHTGKIYSVPLAALRKRPRQ